MATNTNRTAEANQVLDAVDWQLSRIKKILGTTRNIRYGFHPDGDKLLMDLEIVDAEAISDQLPKSIKKMPPSKVAEKVLPILRSITQS